VLHDSIDAEPRLTIEGLAVSEAVGSGGGLFTVRTAVAVADPELLAAVTV
jgi:hypothetical protein